MQTRSILRAATSYRDWTPWLIGMLVVLLAVAVGRQAIRRYAIEQELRQLEENRAELANKNAELTELLDYVRSSNYTEEQARLRLGLSKPGERLAVIADEQNGTAVSQATPTEIATEAKNQKRWWNFFFSP